MAGSVKELYQYRYGRALEDLENAITFIKYVEGYLKDKEILE